MEELFVPDLIVRQLATNYIGNTESYAEIATSNQRLLEENRRLRLIIKTLTTDLNSLKALHADATYLNKQKQLIDELEERQLRLQEENDKMNHNQEVLVVDLNDLREKLSEEISKNTSLNSRVDSLESEVKTLKETLEKRDKSIGFLEQDKENQEKTLKLLLEEKGRHEIEFNQMVQQIKKKNEEMVDKMNEINMLEEQVKQKEKTLRNDQEFFERTKREWDEKRLQFEKAAKQNPKGLEKGRASEEFLSAGFLPRMEDYTSERKGNEYPKSLVRKLLKYHDNEIYSIAQNINGSVLATCGADRVIRFYDPLNQENLGSIAASYSSDKFYTSLKFSNISDILIAGTTENTSEIYNYNTRKLLHKLTGHNSKINDVSFLNDRNKCVSASADRTLKFWDVNKGVVLETISTGSPAKCLEYFNDEPFIVSGHTDGSLRLYSIKDSKLIENIKNLFESDVTCVKISSNNYRILACSKDGSVVKLYDTRIKKVILTYTDDAYFNNHDFNKVAFGPDYKTVFAPNGDGNIIVWDSESGKKKDTLLTDVKSSMISCSYSPITGQLVSADTRGNLFFWH